jgi:hypothetical protein
VASPRWIPLLALALHLGGCGIPGIDNKRVCDESADPCTWDGHCRRELCKDPYVAAPTCSATATSGGLIWSACDNGADINAYCAACYAQDLTLGGRTSWRIPTISELSSLYTSSDVLVDVCGLEAYLNIDTQFDLSCAVVWSSTMTNNDPLYTQIVNFGATASHAVDHVQGSDTVYMRALVVHSP